MTVIKGLSVAIFSLCAICHNAGSADAGGVERITPLVLDLNNIQIFEGVSVKKSLVQFDHLGNGAKRSTGWAKPTMGFLAFDHNGNGRIDNGSELFGQGTLLSNGQKSRNGFIALRELDHNSDGFVDDHDPSFAKLLVWTDANMNALSEPEELKPLSDFGITKLSSTWVPSLRHSLPASVFDNEVRYESRYWGPEKCAESGCLVFDVFFSTLL